MNAIRMRIQLHLVDFLINVLLRYLIGAWLRTKSGQICVFLPNERRALLFVVSKVIGLSMNILYSKHIRRSWFLKRLNGMLEWKPLLKHWIHASFTAFTVSIAVQTSPSCQGRIRLILIRVWQNNAFRIRSLLLRTLESFLSFLHTGRSSFAQKWCVQRFISLSITISVLHVCIDLIRILTVLLGNLNLNSLLLISSKWWNFLSTFCMVRLIMILLKRGVFFEVISFSNYEGRLRFHVNLFLLNLKGWWSHFALLKQRSIVCGFFAYLRILACLLFADTKWMISRPWLSLIVRCATIKLRWVPIIVCRWCLWGYVQVWR